MNAKLDYDVKSNAAYIRFSSNKILESEEISPGVVMDFDADGKIVAIEFLNANERIPAEALTDPHTPPIVEKQATASSVLRHIAYDKQSQTLFVTFAGGDLYAYLDVSHETFEAFRISSSKGHFFATHIRGRSSYVKVPDEEPQLETSGEWKLRLEAANDSFEVRPEDDATVAL